METPLIIWLKIVINSARLLFPIRTSAPPYKPDRTLARHAMIPRRHIEARVKHSFRTPLIELLCVRVSD